LPHHAGSGLGCWANGNGVCREDLGAHPKLRALVGALLECYFLPEHPYLAIEAQVGTLLELLSGAIRSQCYVIDKKILESI